MLSLLIVFFLLSITFSFLCSLWEAVLLSVTPSYAQGQLTANVSWAKPLQSFKENIDRPLAAILTLNTVAHTVGAFGVGHQAATIWADRSPFITVVAVPVTMTIAILILSEIIPKTIGAMNWKALTPFTVISIRTIIVILWPLVWICQGITGLLSRSKRQAAFSRQDFLAMTTIGSQEGEINPREEAFIQNLLKLHQVRLKEILTPRTVMFSVPETMTLAAFYKMQDTLPFSRIPVHHDTDPEDMTGFVLRTDILEQICEGNGSAMLLSLKRPILIKPDTFSAFELFNECIQQRQSIAIVMNEHGAVSGLVTVEDIIEEILGQEIVDETDHVVDMRAHAKSRMKKQDADRTQV